MPLIEELLTILLEPFPCSTNPCIDQSVFGSTNASSSYWSSTSGTGSSVVVAWAVRFEVGFIAGSKLNSYQVRAVRGGS